VLSVAYNRIGMKWLVLGQILLSVGYVWHLVRSYSCKDVPLYLRGLIFSTWLLSFGIVFMLPLDIYYVRVSLHSEHQCQRVRGKRSQNQPSVEDSVLAQLRNYVAAVTGCPGI
jgi:hypothetical protein